MDENSYKILRDLRQVMKFAATPRKVIANIIKIPSKFQVISDFILLRIYCKSSKINKFLSIEIYYRI